MKTTVFHSNRRTPNPSRSRWKAMQRHGARIAVGLVLGAAGVGSVQAQAYPSKPVRVVVAFTAGGTTDILTRLVSQQLSERLKQQFVVDNKPGAGGNIGTGVVE